MADFTQVLKERRSIRKYTDQPVTDEDLNKVLEAVMWSPSWANTQCWEVVVVKDAATKEKLQSHISPKNPAPRHGNCAGASGAVRQKGQLRVLQRPGHHQARRLDAVRPGHRLPEHVPGRKGPGPGHGDRGLFDHDKVNEVIGVPEGFESAVMIPLGHSDQDPKAPKRKPVAEFSHLEKW